VCDTERAPSWLCLSKSSWRWDRKVCKLPYYYYCMYACIGTYVSVTSYPVLFVATFFQLFAPTETCSMETYTVTKDFIILQLLDCVKNRYVFWNYDVATATWVFTGQEPGQGIQSTSIMTDIVIISFYQRLSLVAGTYPRWMTTNPTSTG
jgi:hypothetical protein